MDELYRDHDSGELYCKPGSCPNKRYSEDENLIPLQLEVRKLREESRRWSGERERLLGELDAAQDRLGVALQIRDIPRARASVSAPTGTGKRRSESVPIMLCSDWHCGGVVKPGHVSGLNEFDLGIFHTRAAALFRNALKVIEMARSTVDVQQMVLWLGGDLIDNQLHPDQAQTQELTPTQQIVECERAIVSGLDYLLREAGLDRIIVPCSVGNHGRTTTKQQSNAAQNSYEWLMYQSLRRHYRDEPRIEWHVDDGNILYLDVLGHKLRFHHGDAIKYGGGVGGITIPMNKWIYRQDVGIRANHTFLGHFHTLTVGGSFSVNGSLIGATPYSIKLGFPPERPQQLMRFIDSDRGFTLSAPILAD